MQPSQALEARTLGMQRRYGAAERGRAFVLAIATFSIPCIALSASYPDRRLSFERFACALPELQLIFGRRGDAQWRAKL
ncbi:MAG TPA: hypothetical protein VGJ60_03290 [Chloroflexota bacterium]|jgi:hypothetical protein